MAFFWGGLHVDIDLWNFFFLLKCLLFSFLFLFFCVAWVFCGNRKGWVSVLCDVWVLFVRDVGAWGDWEVGRLEDWER